MNELSIDEFYNILGNFDHNNLANLRYVSKEWRKLVDNNYVWCEMLKKDFHIIQEKDCMINYINIFNERKIIIKEFYETFGLLTPFGNKFIKAPIIKDVTVSEFITCIFESANDHFKGLRSLSSGQDQYFDGEQLQLIIENEYNMRHYLEENEDEEFTPNTILREVEDLSGGYDTPSIYKLFYGLIPDEQELYMVTNKYLDILTIVHGGSPLWTRQQKEGFLVTL